MKNNSIPFCKQTQICRYCKKEFTNKQKRYYCSNRCRTRDKRKDKSKDNTLCPVCGKFVKDYNRKFCSLTCYYKFIGHSDKPLVKVCPVCNNKFETTSGYPNKKFCSKYCFLQYLHSKPEVLENLCTAHRRYEEKIKAGLLIRPIKKVSEAGKKKISESMKRQYVEGKRVSPLQKSKEVEQQIIFKYVNEKKTMMKIEKELSISYSAVSSCLKRNNIAIRSKTGSKHPKLDMSYCTDEWKIAQSERLKRAFAEGRAKVDKTTTPEQDEIMIRMYVEDMVPVPKIAKTMNINMHTIYLRLEEKGIKRREIRRDFHPCWKGGWSLIEYGSNWQQRRKQALERDNHVCCYCGSTKRIDVHHKIKINEFITDEDKCNIGNNLDNLITLCRICHIIEHKEKKVA